MFSILCGVKARQLMFTRVRRPSLAANRPIMSFQAARNRPISSRVVSWADTDADRRACQPGRCAPIAASTCDLRTLPDEQAEPDETATPARSSEISAVSAFTPSTAKQVVLGKRGTAAPKITGTGAPIPLDIVSNSASSQSRSAKTCPLWRNGFVDFADCRAKSGNRSDIFGAGAMIPLLATTSHQRQRHHPGRCGASGADALAGRRSCAKTESCVRVPSLSCRSEPCRAACTASTTSMPPRRCTISAIRRPAG